MIRKNQKFKYTCIKPEELIEDKEYSFSFNPDEQPIFEKFYKVKLNTLKDWSQQMFDILTTLRNCTLNVYLEISHKGRFHYHGWITPTSIPEFIINDLAKLRHYGTYEIDHIGDNEKWKTYVKKQERFMKDYALKNDMHYQIE